MANTPSLTKVLRRNEDIDIKNIIGKPERPAATGQYYGWDLRLDGFFTGTAASKSYGLMIRGDRVAAYAATGDSNDAYLRISGSNYGANDSNFIWRGLNVGITNRSGGTMGRMESSVGAQNKSGGTVPTLIGLTIVPENYGTVATEFGGVDVVLKNEANSATLSYGIRIRNDDRSSQGAIQAALHVSSHASSGGFRELIDASGAVLTEYDTGTQVVLMKFQGANGTTYYLVHDTDSATAVSVATSVS